MGSPSLSQLHRGQPVAHVGTAEALVERDEALFPRGEGFQFQLRPLVANDDGILAPGLALIAFSFIARASHISFGRRDAFLRQALEVSEYYRTRPAYAAALTGAKYEDLPLLTKPEVHEHVREIMRQNLASTAHRWVHTSGTTGTSIGFPVSMEAFQREYACRALHNSWGGVSLHGRDKIAFCAGHPVA